MSDETSYFLLTFLLPPSLRHEVENLLLNDCPNAQTGTHNSFTAGWWVTATFHILKNNYLIVGTA